MTTPTPAEIAATLTEAANQQAGKTPGRRRKTVVVGPEGHSIGIANRWGCLAFANADGSITLQSRSAPMLTEFLSRPSAPDNGNIIWYRGWECGWDDDANRYGMEPWRSYKGGADLDAPQRCGRTWDALLDEIDAEEDDADG